MRRTLNLQLAPWPGLFDKLAPFGTEIAVTAHVRYTNRTTVDIPMGVFDVDSQDFTEGGGGLSLTAPDKWVRVQRARFIGPKAATRGSLVTGQIAALIREALGASEPVVITATSKATMRTTVWGEPDRDKAILDLAKSIGAWVYFDRNGVATIADLPTAGKTANWLVDASATGVLTELDRQRDRSRTYNVVVVSSSASDGELFPTQYVWDDDPDSPTFAGTNPKTAANVGPFGIVPYLFETPTINSVDVDGEVRRI